MTLSQNQYDSVSLDDRRSPDVGEDQGGQPRLLHRGQLAQYAPGVTPVQRRNARLKALGSEKPVRKATSAADVPLTER